MDKKILFLVIFGLLIFSIRLANIDEAIYDDESNFAYSLTVMDHWGFNYDFSSPQPFNFLYKPLLLLFELQTWVFRIVPWLFSIINTILVYWIARRNWGEKAAFYSALLMLISFYPTLASLQFDVEGSFVMFCFIMLFFAYLEYERDINLGKQRRWWQLLAGTALGLAIILKYNSVYIVPVLLGYVWMKNKWQFKPTLKSIAPIFAIGFILFSAYLLFATMVVPVEKKDSSIPFYSWYDGFISKYRPNGISPLGIILFALWSTPLLFGFYLISIFNHDEQKRLLIFWISGALLFYSLVLTYGAMDRYLMNTIPALALLGGITIAQFNFSRNNFITISMGSILYSSLLFVINPMMKIVPRLPSSYAYELKHFNASFLFSYTSSSGPTFGVNFLTIFITFLIAFFCLVLFFYHRKDDHCKNYIHSDGKLRQEFYRCSKKSICSTLFAVFLVVSIGFNIFLTTEYLFHPTGVDVSAVKYDMLYYVREQALPFPMYSNDAGLMWYLQHHQWKTRSDPGGMVLGIPDQEVGTDASFITTSINQRGGTILLLNWPPLPKKSPAFDVTPLCSVVKRFYSKEMLLGEIYQCS